MTGQAGLTTKQAEILRKKFGFNEITEKKPGIFFKFAKWAVSPISLMLLAAALLSLVSRNVFDFWFILSLALLNFFISFWQEHKADNAVAKLQSRLSAEARTLRDGFWQSLPSRMLVPGDFVELGIGDIVPADSKITECDNFSVNEASLTGESLPVEKNKSDKAFSGSFIVTGRARVLVEATGGSTFFGKALMLVQKSNRRSLLEEDVLRISRFLSFLSLAAVVILTAALLAGRAPAVDILLLDLSLVIAGIPISLPTIMSLIIGFGVLELAKEQAVVRQLSALEDLANVDLLLSDKTGTLTKNFISVEKIISYDPGLDEKDIIKMAAATASQERQPISQAVMTKFRQLGAYSDWQVMKIIPADSERKRSTAFLKTPGGQNKCVVVGATQVVAALCEFSGGVGHQFELDIKSAAASGYRSLAVAAAAGEKEEKMKLQGLLLLSDTPFEDSKSTLDFLKANGIAVKMLTGDNMSVSRRVAEELGLDGEEGKVVDKKELDASASLMEQKKWWESRTVFAEILPEDKLKLVRAAKRFYRVAVTGDGVNDLAAIKTADVGVAVSNAVDALKSAADIVLLSPGIAVIEKSVFEARKIFARLYSYSVYRISESLRLIVTVAFLGIAYKFYPLSPVQLILLAFLNDLPIISLAFNRVAVASRPAVIKVRERFALSSLLGIVGVANSLLMFFIADRIFNLAMPVIQTLFFLKLAVGGHMLIYVAHTDKPWYEFLPSRPVILATTLTQLAATAAAGFGVFMAKAPVAGIVAVWCWAFFWMQISELAKHIKLFGNSDA